MTGGEIAALAAVGLAAGVFSGLFGVGGGILFVPALAIIGDLSQLAATATSLAAIVPVTAVGAWRQRRYGNLRLRAALLVGVTSAAGVAGGTVLAESLPETALRRLFAALLLVTAAQLVWSQRPSRAAQQSREAR